MPFISSSGFRGDTAILAEHPRQDFPARIPVTDTDAWTDYIHHRWVYMKPQIAETQKLRWGPAGVTPSAFPVFLRPICNLWGYGLGARKIHDRGEYERTYTPGTFWTEYLEGDHWSVDCLIEQCGLIPWFAAAKGERLGDASFKSWRVGECPAILQRGVARWVTQWIPNYWGQLNVEFIGGKIIEVHLRLGYQFLPFYGEGFVDAFIAFMDGEPWCGPSSSKYGISYPEWDSENEEMTFRSVLDARATTDPRAELHPQEKP